MNVEAERVLAALATGSVVLTLDGDDRPINAAIKDAEGSWALGGKPDPWTSEKLALGINRAKARLVTLYEAAA